jgi:hypothetical protein
MTMAADQLEAEHVSLKAIEAAGARHTSELASARDEAAGLRRELESLKRAQQAELLLLHSVHASELASARDEAAGLRRELESLKRAPEAELLLPQRVHALAKITTLPRVSDAVTLDELKAECRLRAPRAVVGKPILSCSSARAHSSSRRRARRAYSFADMRRL